MTNKSLSLKPVVTRAHWFGEPDRPTISWISESEQSSGKSGVILLPPIGYEYWTTHRSMRMLAERLARSGHSVLRLDYSGTGDSSGDKWDAGTLDKWKRDIQFSAQELRKLGVSAISLVGLRIGATLALISAQEIGADAVVAWIPVTSGRRYVKELQLLSMEAPEDSVTIGGSGTRFLAGCVFTSELRGELSGLSVDDVQTSARVLILDRPDKISSKGLAEQLGSRGAIAEQRLLDGVQKMLDVPTEYATAPLEHLDAITEWLRPPHPVEHAGIMQSGKLLQPEGRFLYGTTGISEREVRLGKHEMVGIECSPTEHTVSATVVFLNTGSEPHIGPGRAWVELCRQLAAIGYRTIRIDFQGWGESPDNGYAPGRPYDPHTVDDAREIVNALSERGDQKIVLVGLCASAWVALRNCEALPICGIVAFNPQLYWQPGDPVLATMPEAIAWCRNEGQKVWTESKRKTTAYNWFERIRKYQFPVDFWFEENDMGIQYLRDQLNISIPGQTTFDSLTITELKNLDHAMHRQWNRSEAFEAIASMLKRISTKNTEKK